ncbi:hypothetical protein GOODEAATRI_002504 [Goodea atripinnis]|uniref:Uncharacterized protein n=1 Tax=Goodea atripinnis TaxID=208336 RepID=A0ABV0PK69_9TELE
MSEDAGSKQLPPAQKETIGPDWTSRLTCGLGMRNWGQQDHPDFYVSYKLVAGHCPPVAWVTALHRLVKMTQGSLFQLLIHKNISMLKKKSCFSSSGAPHLLGLKADTTLFIIN